MNLYEELAEKDSLITAQSARIAELEAQIAAASAPVVEQQPAGYIRKWAFDGEKPEKRLNANNRMAWPGKFKFLPVTQAQILPDDIPLYVAHQAADTDKLREFVEAVATNYSGINNQERLYCYGCEADLDDQELHKPDCIVLRAQAMLSSTALQAPVREVPGWLPIETAPKSRMDRFVVIAFDVELNHGKYTSDPYCTWPEKDGSFARWPHTFKPTHWMPLPAAPVQQEGE